MKLPRELGFDDLVKALGRLDYQVVRQTGSHIRLRCEALAHSVTVPAHKPLKVGTLAGILSDIGERLQLDRATLLATLFD